MEIVRAGLDYVEAWAALRNELWPDGTDDHDAEIAAIIAAPPDAAAAFVAVEDGTVVGFVEAGVRHDYVNGCDTSPVGFVEGLFVSPEWRRLGVAAALVAAVEDWARALGMIEIGSDADIDNAASHAIHAALGYAETERVVCFRKHL